MRGCYGYAALLIDDIVWEELQCRWLPYHSRIPALLSASCHGDYLNWQFMWHDLHLTTYQQIIMTSHLRDKSDDRCDDRVYI